MERGFVQGDSRSTPASISWVAVSNEEVIDLKPIPFWGFSNSPQFPAFRCAGCGLIEVDYLQSVD